MSALWQIIAGVLASFLKGWWTSHEHDEKQTEVKDVQDSDDALSDAGVSKRMRSEYTRD